MPRKSGGLSRRQFIRRTVGSGVAASVPLQLARAEGTGAKSKGIIIHAPSPAGPAPYGAPVELSIPFGAQRLRDVKSLAVLTPARRPVLAQFRPVLHWPDGSVKWLAVAFEPETGPGDYSLETGTPRGGSDLVTIEGDRILVDTGGMAFAVAKGTSGWFQMLDAPGPDGTITTVLEGSTLGDLVLTRHDGKVFRASLDRKARTVVIEERGSVCATLRIEGQCLGEDGERLFDYILRCTAYRGRSDLFLTLTWINCTRNISEQLRDVRVHFPLGFALGRLVIGCEQGVYDGPFLRDRVTYILQDDDNRYWVKEQTEKGRTLHLSSGGCNGEHAPGWLYVRNRDRCLAVLIPHFWEEYPNEIQLKEKELSLGLWPERAADHLGSKPLLPRNPQGTAYTMADYWPVMPHPYLAFFDSEKKCLDARQGTAKTQEIVLSVWAGQRDGPAFERKWWNKSLLPVRGHLDPEYVATTGALGPMWPHDNRNFASFEKLFDESFGWLDRHIDLQKCYGKFDYGDFRYFTAAPDYMCYPGTKWGDMGEMPREGYWHNNERDALLGMLAYYYRTADPVVWERCRIVARHLLDIDIRHFPHWGMWTHSYGHCYLALGEAGEPDHSWLLGLLVWAGASGDPVVWDWLKRCGERLRNLEMDFTQADARTAALYLHMMCQFYQYTGEPAYLEAAKAPVQAFLQLQNANGSWPAYLGNLKQPRIEGFVEHALMALSDYYCLHPDEPVRKALDRALVYLYGEDGEGKPDEGESPLALYGLAVLAEKTGEAKYAATTKKVLSKLSRAQNLSPDLMGRGDLMAQWGVNNLERAKGTGRPPQFLGQTRPLTPACILAYGMPAVALIAKLDGAKTG